MQTIVVPLSALQESGAAWLMRWTLENPAQQPVQVAGVPCLCGIADWLHQYVMHLLLLRGQMLCVNHILAESGQYLPHQGLMLVSLRQVQLHNPSASKQPPVGTLQEQWLHWQAMTVGMQLGNKALVLGGFGSEPLVGRLWLACIGRIRLKHLASHIAQSGLAYIWCPDDVGPLSSEREARV